MVTKVGRRMDKLSENFNKEIEYRKKDQSELKNTITDMKNTLERINSRVEDAEDISDLEDRELEIIKLEQQTERELGKMRRQRNIFQMNKQDKHQKKN